MWDTTKKLFRGVNIQLKKIFCHVGHNMEDYSTVWDTMGKIILPMGYTVKKLIQGGIIFVYFHFSKATIKQNHFCGLTHPRGVLKNEKLRRFL